MAGTGPNNAGYKIPELVVSDTFHDWFKVTNLEIIDKLNRMQVYSIGTADGISGSTASDGTATFEIGDTITKGITFEGDVRFNGAVTRVNSTDFSVDDYHLVLGDTGPVGATSAGTGADDSVIGASGGGGLILRRGEAEDATWLWKPIDVAGASSGAWHSGETGDSHIRMAAAARFLSSDDTFRFSGGSSGEWLGIHSQNVPDRHYWGGTGEFTGEDDLILSYGSSLGATSEFMRVHDNGYVDIMYGVNKKRITKVDHGFTFGEAIRYDITHGYTWAKADDHSRAEALGLVSYVNGNTFDITYFGEVKGDFSAAIGDEGATIGSGGELVEGYAYFLSAANKGKITTTITETVNHVQKPMLIATGTGEGLVVNYIGGIIAEAGDATSAANQRILIQGVTTDFRMGDVVRMNPDSGLYVRAECNTPETSESIGVITDTDVAGEPNDYYLSTSGVVSFGTDEIGLGGMPSGEVYFLNSNCAATATTGGCLTINDPDTVGFVRKPIMVAVNSTQAVLLNHIGVRISGDIDGATQLKSMTGKTFVPVEAATGTKMIGQFFRNHDGNSVNDRKGRFHHCGFNSTNGMQLLHIALNGNTASNPIMDNEINYGNVWDTTQGAPPTPLFPWGTLAEETALAVGWDEYDSQGWGQWNTLNSASDDMYMTPAPSGKRLNIPSNATHIILRMRTNINVSANVAMTTYCAQYNHDVIQSNWADQQDSWLNKHFTVTQLDPSTGTNEEEEFATVIVPIDPQATGSHIMLAFYGYIKTHAADAGVYDLLVQIYCDGFYVDDVPVMAPNGVGGQGRRKNINGNFDFWQRGPSFGATAEYRTAWLSGNHLKYDSGDCYTADRWHTFGASGSNWSMKQEEFNLAGVAGTDYLPSTAEPARYYCKVVNGGNDNPNDETGSMSINTVIEDATTFSGKKFSYSLWVKGDVSPQHGGTANEMFLRFYRYPDIGRNTAGGGTYIRPNSSDKFLIRTTTADDLGWGVRDRYSLTIDRTDPIVSNTFSISGAWKKIVGTIDMPSVAGQTDYYSKGCTYGLGCLQCEIVPSVDSKGWTGEFSIAQLQLEEGNVITNFERREEAIEYNQCKRFFQTSFDWRNRTYGWPLANGRSEDNDDAGKQLFSDSSRDIYSAVHRNGDRAVGYTNHQFTEFSVEMIKAPMIMPFSVTGVSGAVSIDQSCSNCNHFPSDINHWVYGRDADASYHQSTLFVGNAFRGDMDGHWRDIDDEGNDVGEMAAGEFPKWWNWGPYGTPSGISAISVLVTDVLGAAGEATIDIYSNRFSYKDMRYLYGSYGVGGDNPATINGDYQTLGQAMSDLWGGGAEGTQSVNSELFFNYTADAEY